MTTDVPTPANRPGPLPIELELDGPRFAMRVLVFCAACELMFIVLDYFINYGRLTDSGPIRRFFNNAREDAFPSWFAYTQVWTLALVVWAIWAVSHRSGVSAWTRRGWLGFALFFSYVSVDDGAKVHERVGSWFAKVFEKGEAGDGGGLATWLLEAFPSYPWQIVFVPIFGPIGLLLLWFLWRQLDERRLRWVVVAALVCLVVAVTMDFFEGTEPDHPLNPYTALAQRFDIEDWTQRRFQKNAYDTFRHFSKSFEESLEMFGFSLLLYVFIHQLTGTAAELRLRLSGRSIGVTPPR